MKVNILCCLLACILGCTVTAGLTRAVVKEEKDRVTLPCPHSVGGKVTWSRESEGRKVDILTVDGDGNTKHINDSGKRYNSLADRSLFILRVSVSDSGRYFCNNKTVKLTVIPSGTTISSVEESGSIALQCPHDVGGSGVPKWRNDTAEIQQGRIRVSTENRTLIITEAEPADSGLYYCDGKPAAYLNVTKGGSSAKATTTPTTRPTTTTTPPPPTTPTTTTTPPPPTTPTTPTTTTTTTTKTKKPTKTTKTTTTTPTTKTTKTTKTTTPTTTTQRSAVTSASATSPPSVPPRNSVDKRALLLGIGVLVLVILVLIIIYFTWRRRSNRRGNDKQGHVYEEIPAAELKVINGASNQNDATYATIPELPQTGNESGSPYSLIVSPFHAGNNKGVSKQNDPAYATIPDLPLTGNKSGSSQPTDSTYFLLEKPK